MANDVVTKSNFATSKTTEQQKDDCFSARFHIQSLNLRQWEIIEASVVTSYNSCIIVQ